MLQLFYFTACVFAAVTIERALSAYLQVSSVAFRIQTLIALLMGTTVSGYLLLGLVELTTGTPLANSWWLCAPPVLLFAYGYTRARNGPAAPPVISRADVSLHLDGYSKIALASAVLGIGCIALAVLPGYPKGFEASAYHLPNAVRLLQSGSLLPWDDWYAHAQPFNASIVYAVLLGFLPEHIVALTSVVFTLGICLAVYRTSVLLDADRSSAAIAACGLLSVPIVAFNAGELEADIASLFFVSFATVLVVDPALRRGLAIFLAGCAAGIAYGSKILHLVSSAILFAFVMCPPLETRERAEAWSKRVRFGGFYVLGFLLLAGFWLLRNWALYGNPAYPAALPVIGQLLHWHGAPELLALQHAEQTEFEWVRTRPEWLVYPWREWHFLNQNYKHSSGLGIFFAATVLPAVAVAILRVAKTCERALVVFIAASATVLLGWWYIGDRQPRYFMAAFVFMFPVSAVLLSAAKRYGERLSRTIAITGIAAMMVIIGSLHLIFATDRVLLSHGYERYRYYEYPQIIDALPVGSRLLVFAERTWHYPLAGKHLTNVVYSFPKSLQLAGSTFEQREPSAPLTISDEILKRERITHVFVDGFSVSTRGEAELVEIGRVATNPVNNLPLQSPRVLYKVVWR